MSEKEVKREIKKVPFSLPLKLLSLFLFLKKKKIHKLPTSLSPSSKKGNRVAT